MTQRISRVAFSVLVLALGGCWVGRLSASLPERLPSKDLPPLAGPISFDLCLAPPAPPRTDVELELERRKQGGRNPDEPCPRRASRPSSRRSPECPWSSRSRSAARTLSIAGARGCRSSRSLSCRDIPEGDAGDVAPSPSLALSESHEGAPTVRVPRGLFLLGPLIVCPDLFGTISGGWQSSSWTTRTRIVSLAWSRNAWPTTFGCGWDPRRKGVGEQNRRRRLPEGRAIVSAVSGRPAALARRVAASSPRPTQGGSVGQSPVADHHRATRSLDRVGKIIQETATPAGHYPI